MKDSGFRPTIGALWRFFSTVKTNNTKRWKMATSVKKAKGTNSPNDEMTRITDRDAGIAELA
jgi:hypothetical protein